MASRRRDWRSTRRRARTRYALNVASEVRDKMAVLKREFPQGLISDIPFDTTKFVEQSIHEVY